LAAAAAAAISRAWRSRSFAKKITEKKKYRIIGVEPSACPTLTRGELRYDFGDTAETTPLLKMYTLGHKFMPPTIHAGGLRYHGMSPMVSHALKLGLIEAEAYHHTKVFEAATLFARSEGIVPAPESAHAIASIVNEATKAREAGGNRFYFSISQDTGCSTWARTRAICTESCRTCEAAAERRSSILRFICENDGLEFLRVAAPSLEREEKERHQPSQEQIVLV
jgi:hypothetical protein